MRRCSGPPRPRLTTRRLCGRLGAVCLRRLVLLLRDLEHVIHGRVSPNAEHTLRNVITDLRAELESLGVAAGGDPHVRPLRVPIDDEVSTRGRLVVTSMRLGDRSILQERE